MFWKGLITDIEKINELQAHIVGHMRVQKVIKFVRIKKMASMGIFLLFFPYLVCRYIIARVFLFYSQTAWKVWCSRFIRHYFGVYFYFQGVIHYKATPLPKTLEPGTLILMPRINAFAPIYTYRLFKTPLIMPLAPGLMTPKGFPFLPGNLAPRLLQYVSYPDQRPDNHAFHVTQLLAAGHSVIAYVNEGFADPGTSDSITFYKAIKTLLQYHGPTYFFHLGGMEKYIFATYFTHILVKCDLIKKEALFEGVSTNDYPEKLDRMAEFYNFLDFKYIS
ncbi:MAG: hypothetical protein ACI9BD_001335 [Candidatus Marinamargulisbacteria bacterium]|jgi:hypothetical protein